MTAVERLAAMEGLTVLGWRDVPHEPRLRRGRPRGAARSGAAVRGGHGGRERPAPRPAGVLPAQAGRARGRRATSPACPPGPSCTRACSPRPSSSRSTPTCPTSATSPAPGPGPLPVLHQHVPVLAAGPPVPLRRPQRRDQHRAGQPQLDAGPRGDARHRPDPASRRQGIERLFPIIDPDGQRLGQLRRVPGAAAPRRPVAAARGADDDPRAVGEPRGDGRRRGGPSTSSTPR